MIDTDALNASLSALDVGKRLGLNPNRMGFCRCPVHGEKTGSMKLYAEPGRGWYCFGCHQGGDVIKLTRIALKCDFKGAVAFLDEQYGLGLANDQTPSEREETLNRLRQAKRDRERREEAIRTADELRAIADAMAVRCQRVMDETMPKDPASPWDKRYFEAKEAYETCLEMSDRMLWASQELEKQNGMVEMAMKLVEKYRAKAVMA